jgi:phage host-nuclease inhibitor protein Gam
MASLSNVRTMTVADADKAMEELALLAAETKVKKAKADAKILTIKSDYEQHEAAAEARMRELRSVLAAFILDRAGDTMVFGKARSRKTNFGKYGLHVVTSVEVDDADRALGYCETHGLSDAIRITKSLVKDALAKLVKAGEAVPGVRVASGDEPFATVDPAFLKSRVEELTR